MHGDFSRDAFNPVEAYTRVLLQQGRPLTDADWNENTALLLYQQRQFISDLMGRHGGTFDGGFEIQQDGDAGNNTKKWKLSAGSYYVDGLRCESHDEVKLDMDAVANGDLLYLEAWEEDVNPLEDPRLLEPMLAGIDTSWRSRVRWCVRKLSPVVDEPLDTDERRLEAMRIGQPILRVRRTSTDSGHDGVCNTQEASRTRGPTWVRIEIHRTGIAQTLKANGGDEQPLAKTATFKWCIGNGGAVYGVTDGRLKVPEFVRGAPLKEQHWYEQFPADASLPGILRLVERLGDSEWGLSKPEPAARPAETHPVVAYGSTKRPCEYARGWHFDGPRLARHVEKWPRSISPGSKLTQPVGGGPATLGDAERPVVADDGAALVTVNQTKNEGWIKLASGVEIQFDSSPDALYRTGDYWLIRVDPDGTVTVNGRQHKKGKDHSHDLRSGMRRAFAPIAQRTEADGNGWGDLRRRYDRVKLIGFVGAATPFVAAAQPRAPAERHDDPPPDAASPSARLLSPDGLNELRRHVSLPQDILRRIPARYLAFTPRTQTVRRWMSTSLVSELVKQKLGDLIERLRPVAFPTDAWPEVEADARDLLEVAGKFSAVLSSEEGIRELLA